MATIALWTFNETPGSSVAADSVTSDGTAQDGAFRNGATTDGLGSGIFDGVNDYVEVPSDPGFDLDAGSIIITFTQNTTSPSDRPFGNNAAQTLFSRDSSGFDGGGHLTIFLRSDGSVGVRHQDTNSSSNFEGGNVTLGQPTTVAYTWSPTGSQLIVDGVVVDTGTEALTLAGNSEPIVIGASQAQSGNAVANNVNGFFDGQIERVRILDDVVGASTVPCFTRGTSIQTPSGAVPVETLRIGDLVCTLHHGLQPVRWIGTRFVHLGDTGNRNANLRPVRIRAGALGRDLPTRDLLVSRQHRMLVSSRIASRMFDYGSALVAAAKLTQLPGIIIDESLGSVEYFHVVFEQHQVIFAEDAPTESLYLGNEAMNAFSPKARQEIRALFPDINTGTAPQDPALPIPSNRRQKQLVARHAKNNLPVLDTFTPFAELTKRNSGSRNRRMAS